jgi:hypothetical protein
MPRFDAPLLARFRPLAWLGGCFLGISMLTRLVLLVATGNGVPASASNWLYVFGVGLGYDLLAFAYFSVPLVLLLWLLPRRWLARRWGSTLVATLCLVLLSILLFVAVSEWTFWEEFQARFNFIAVDYLVYTTEVIGNIRESYPIGLILSSLALVTGGVFIATRRWRLVRNDSAGFGARSLVVAGWLAAGVLGTWLVSGDMKDRTANTYVNELAGNGIYQFFAAYRSASLDYARYYRTVPADEARAIVRAQLATPDATFLATDGIARHIHNAAPERRLNVVLISVESLSAEYSGVYGRKDSLTPNLDALAKDSLLFTDLWATGTRTVRGLEALALSVPPTPGESIVKRAHNEGLFSLGQVFRDRGYDAQFLYGGYGAFDDMNRFFAGNGYDVHDRTEIAGQGHPPRQHLGRRRRRPVHHGDASFRCRCRRGQAVLRAPDDHLQPPALHLPGRAWTVAAGQARERGELHGLGDRRFPAPRAKQAVVRQHPVRGHRRPLRLERRHRGIACVPVPDSHVGVFAGQRRARSPRTDDQPGRHRADRAWPAGHGLRQPLLRRGCAAAAARP